MNHLKYKPSYCKKIVALMQDGLTITEAAVELGIAKSTFYEWKQNHPEFDAATDEGNWRHLAWSCRQLRQNMHNKDFQYRNMRMIMHNCHRWSDNIQKEVTVSERRETPEEALKRLGEM